MELAGKSAVVTGAGSGIGRAIAERFASQGAAVTLFDLKGAEAAAAEIASRHGRALGIAGDVARRADIDRCMEAARAAHGPIDILVNNAGLAFLKPFMETGEEEFRRTLDVNVTAALLLAQAAAPDMIRQGRGRIVNVASISGQRAGIGRTAYGASKAALIQLTKQMALELAPHNITANAIAPGPVETDMAKLMHDEKTRAGYLHLVPLGRYASPEEIAEAALFLASDRASYVTGHVLDVDGGFMATGLR